METNHNIQQIEQITNLNNDVSDKKLIDEEVAINLAKKTPPPTKAVKKLAKEGVK